MCKRGSVVLASHVPAALITAHACAAGELLCELPVVISNHGDLEGVAANFGIPFRCFPLAKGASSEAKREQVAKSFMLLATHVRLGCCSHKPGNAGAASALLKGNPMSRQNAVDGKSVR